MPFSLHVQQPFQIELGDGDAVFVGIFGGFALFVEQEEVLGMFIVGQAGVGAAAGPDGFGMGPRFAVIEADADGHVFAHIGAGIGEKGYGAGAFGKTVDIGGVDANERRVAADIFVFI